MAAKPLYKSKIFLLHENIENRAVAELKVWKVAQTNDFPEGIKYSMFLVNLTTSTVIVGFDNHKPKGHHLHIDGEERSYHFINLENLIKDFWNYVEEKGYIA